MSFNFLASWKSKPTAAIKIVVLINWPHYPIALLLPGYLCNCLHTLYMSILWVYTVRTHNTFISFLFFHFSLLILSSSSSPPFSIFSYFNLRKPAWWYQSTKNTNKSQPYADISDDIVLMSDDVPFPVFESSFTQQQKPYGFNKNDIIYFANL